jgi:hypothetical protein
MRRSMLMVCVCLAIAFTGIAHSQSAGPRTWEQMRAAFDEHKGEFDYLLGDWEFTGIRREPEGERKFHGYWSALKLAEGQILDEYRVIDDKGETVYVTTTLRAYNGQRDQWDLISADTGAGLRDLGVAHWAGTEMRLEQTFGVGTKYPTNWRIHYHDIQPDRFKWAADRSIDDGKTWVANFQTIEARRIGPARSMGPLAQPKKLDSSRDGRAK